MLKTAHYARLLQRLGKEMLSGKSGKFAKHRIFDKDKIKGWHYTEISQPLIKPPGQEDIFNNKVHNINLVIEKINLLEIKPGEIFSFWRLVGFPTAQKGFKSASVFLCNKVEREIGGGLCQVSTAIYGAALHSGCEIVERYSHSIDAYDAGRYFPLGQDATITFPHMDLQFRNIFDSAIVLECFFEGNSMKARIYSPRKFCNVKIESKLIGTSSRKVEYVKSEDEAEKEEIVIQEGSDGKIVEIRRVVEFPNGIKSNHLVYVDTYKQVPKIIKKG